MKNNISLTVLFSTVFLSACGGGGSSGSSSTATVGYLLDAPLVGVSYLASPSNSSGQTDSSGKFTFQPGDTIKFWIPTASTTDAATATTSIGLGSYTPANSADNKIVITDLPGGIQSAQVIQSLASGSAATSYNVASFIGSSTVASNLSAIKSFIDASGSIAANPSGVTVSQLSAISNVYGYLASNPTLISQTGIDPNYFKSATFYLVAPGQPVSNGLPVSIGSLDAAGNWFDFLNNTSGSSSVSGNTLNLTRVANGITYSNSITFPVFGQSGGTFKNIHTELPNPINNNTSNGIYRRIDTSLSALSINNLKGKTIVINLSSDGVNNFCSDNKIKYTFNPTGTSYTRACNTGVTSLSSFSSSGSISTTYNNSAIPAGFLVFTDANNFVYGVGMVSGGSLASSGTGSLVMAFLSGSIGINTGIAVTPQFSVIN